jgi:hypothetical protein
MVYRTEYSLVIAIKILVEVADQYGRLQQLEESSVEGDLAELRCSGRDMSPTATFGLDHLLP